MSIAYKKKYKNNRDINFYFIFLLAAIPLFIGFMYIEYGYLFILIILLFMLGNFLKTIIIIVKAHSIKLLFKCGFITYETRIFQFDQVSFDLNDNSLKFRMSNEIILTLSKPVSVEESSASHVQVKHNKKNRKIGNAKNANQIFDDVLYYYNIAY